VIADVTLKSAFFPGDEETGGSGVEGIRSGRGGVLGVHFPTGDPSFGGVWGNSFLSVSAIMLFMSYLKTSQLLSGTKHWSEAYLTTGPIGFHLLIPGDSSGTGGDEGTPSIANISSETLLDIDIGAEPSGIDLCRVASERSLIGWVRTIN